MGVVLRTWAIFAVTLKRLFSQRWLALATILGLVASVALIVSIPLYADAIYYRVLHEDLSGSPSGARPPLPFTFRYVGPWAELLEWEDVRPVDEYLSSSAGPALGPPQKSLIRYFETDGFRLFPQEDTAYADTREALTRASFAFVTGLEDHITVLEGHFPAPADPSPDSIAGVLVSESRALKLGLQVGETYVAFARRETEQGERTVGIPVRVAGVWRPTDFEDEFWLFNPEELYGKMLVPEETFRDRLSPYLDDEIRIARWLLVMDASDIHVGDVVPLLRRIAGVEHRASAILPGTRLDESPARALRRYRHDARLLTFLLYAFSVPIVGLILAFIGQVVGLAVGRQRNDIAVLRSRGATATQVVGIAGLEAVLLGAVALGVGLPAGAAIAQFIGKARSFLDFTLRSHLRVGVTAATTRMGMTAVGLAFVAQILPTINAARHTVVTYKQERARALRPPWWQRVWLDVLLFVPAAYGAYLLRQQGSIALLIPTGDGSLVNRPFQNPLLFLVPALGVLALTLFILRVIPLVMSGIAWIASRMGGVGVLLAARHLSRTPRYYTAPLVLLVLTLSLSTFTASLARTLDHHLYDQIYYRTGADMYVVETGQDPDEGGMPAGGPSSDDEGATADDDEGPHWLILPVSEHLKAPGVQAVARVGRYKAVSRLSGGTQIGTFIGVDRVDFTRVAFWREDFASSSLGALMNQLALAPNGVLVPRSFLTHHALKVGDTFRLRVASHGYRLDAGERAELDLRVVGVFDLFPTWYPSAEDAGPLWVGNLEYLFEQAEGQFPYHVWLRTDSDVDYRRILDELADMRLRVLEWDFAPLRISEAQQRPERQGLFGVLSVGFIGAALLTVLGFLLYAFFSFRRRFIELGVLRAIGLSVGQMTAFLAWELAFLILIGLIAGTGLGVWASRLFIPYLQVGTGPSAQTPPYVVEIAWPAVLRIHALFGLLFAGALGGLTALLTRMKIFQAVKLGETA